MITSVMDNRGSKSAIESTESVCCPCNIYIYIYIRCVRNFTYVIYFFYNSNNPSSTRGGGLFVSRERTRRTIRCFFAVPSERRKVVKRVAIACVKRSPAEVVGRLTTHCRSTGESGLVFRINVSSINRISHSFVALPSLLVMRNAFE